MQGGHCGGSAKEAVDLSEFGLSVSSDVVAWFWESRGWRATVATVYDQDVCEGETALQWTDGICSVFTVGKAGNDCFYRYRYEGLAEGRFDFVTRQIDLKLIDPLCSDATLFHFLSDVLLPAILDYQGDLVVHAGAVVVDGAAVLFLGESGRGKSTLTASFLAEGGTILSDDGIIVTCSDRCVIAEAVYPGVRLLPDSLSALFDASIPTAEVAHYAAKRRIIPDSRMSAGKYPAALLIFLSEPQESGKVSLAPMSAADACMGLVSKSFALNPSDKDRARGRIGQASRVANTLPAYALNYPRMMSSLPQVREAIFDALAVGGPRNQPRSVT